MRLRPTGGLDLATGALIGGGAVLIAASLVAAVVFLTPPATVEAPPASTPPVATQAAVASRPSVALPADRVAAVLYVDAAAGAGSAARSGDRVDVLGYFSHQVTGSENVTRLLLQDVSVLTTDRSGANVALTLAVSQDAALLLQEAQALGVRPFVTLRPVKGATAPAPSSTLSDADLVGRLAGGR
jgi:Flp pilus assembly protein CpaB